MIHVSVQREDFSLDAELDRLQALGGGGIASFVGIVRADDGVEELFLDHYPGMTEAMLHKLAEEAAARWTLLGTVLIHRVGPLRPGERIVLTATCAAHRRDSLEACAFLIDRLKTDAPFWKRERRGGQTRWVEQRASDVDTAEEWLKPTPSPRA